MKKQLAILLIFFSSLSYGQSAVEYMESLTRGYQQMQNDMWDYTKSISHGKSARTVEKRRMELIATAKTNLRIAENSKGFNGSTAYRDSVVKYLTIVNLVLNEDYAKLVDMEDVAEQSYDQMEAYILAKQLANKKQEDASKMVNTEQAKFAKDNNITLVESTSGLDKKMEIAGDVYDHYNKVYLAFFKSNKQELYLMDAIKRKDVNAIEQNKEALISTVEEGEKKLTDIKLYENDRSMIQATENLFVFYRDEAKNKMDVVLNYFLKSENFEKIKTSYDQIKEKDRTQKDVNTFNDAVNEMNNAVNAYNAQNAQLNSKRTGLIDAWNKTSENFTNKHIPKGK